LSRPKEPSAAELAALAAAFNQLYVGLEKATIQFAEHDDAGRSGVIAALETVLRFLQQSSVISSHGLIMPLARLHSDLLALDDGNLSALLSPKPRSGRARASGFYDGLKGLAVFTVQALITPSMRRVDARKLVARRLNELGISPARKGSKHPSGKITERTLREWQEYIAADVGLRSSAAQTFREAQTEFQKANFTAAELLDRLSVYVKATRGAETT
jgi:hypothetical protein